MKKIRKPVLDTAILAEVLDYIDRQINEAEEQAENYAKTAQEYPVTEVDADGNPTGTAPDPYYLDMSAQYTAKAEAWERLLNKLAK